MPKVYFHYLDNSAKQPFRRGDFPEVSKAGRVCLRRFRGFAPKNPTTFEKVDETFAFLNFLNTHFGTCISPKAAPSR